MFIAFPLQEMYERASLLPYMYIVCFVYYAVRYLLFGVSLKYGISVT